MCASTFSTAFHVNERPDYSTRLEPAGNLHGTGGLGEALGKGVVDAVLHRDPVGADAGLAGIPIFRGDRSLDRHLDIGVVEDDERRVAAQFKRELFDRAGALLHQQFADLRRAGEGQFVDDSPARYREWVVNRYCSQIFKQIQGVVIIDGAGLSDMLLCAVLIVKVSLRKIRTPLY